MAEILEKDAVQADAPLASDPPVDAAPTVSDGSAKKPGKWKSMPRKKRRRIIRLIVILLIVIALAAGGILFFGNKSGGDSEVGTEFVSYGSITSMVEGSGLVKARTSETLALNTAGTVVEVFVTEGQQVNEGDPLFTIDSPAALAAVQTARSTLEGYQKQFSTAMKDMADLNLTAPFTGKLLDTQKLTPGADFSGGQVATLVDDTKMRLTQYYSYAYAGQLAVGQSMEVSIPSCMANVTGTVEAVHMVSRITPEGSKLFSADIVIPNAGALTADMVATASTTLGGEAVYPYEAGKLEYYRSIPLEIRVSGTVISSALLDYLNVTAGQMLVRIDGESSEAEIFSIQQDIESAQENLEKAEKNLANCNAVAPISGQVIGLNVYPGMELDPAATPTLVTISDTSSVTISATVDERNISYISVGTPVDVNQWDTMAFGMVETVSLSSTINNGVASYPITISADNYDGMLQVNSYANYTLTASQNDNCLVLPLQAVRTVSLEDGSMATVVYVRADSRPDNAVDAFSDEAIPEGFYPVAVEIGIQDNYNVEIKSGVEEGTEVFTQMMTTEVWG